MKHISIEEMLSFMQIKELTSSNLKLVNKFNHHIYQCEQCRNNYKELSEIVESLEKSISLDDEKIRMLQGCFKTFEKSSSEIIELFKNSVKNIACEISIVIESLTEITTSNLLSGFSFYHPIPVGVAKSTNVMEAKKATDILIDDKCNRISVAQDGTLSLRFQKDICEVNQYVFLIPDDIDQDVSIAIAKEGSDGLVRAEFYDLLLGGYKIII